MEFKWLYLRNCFSCVFPKVGNIKLTKKTAAQLKTDDRFFYLLSLFVQFHEIFVWIETFCNFKWIEVKNSYKSLKHNDKISDPMHINGRIQ